MSPIPDRDWILIRKEACQALEEARIEARAALEGDGAAQNAFGALLGRLRIHDPGTHKAVARAVASAPEKVRRALSILGPSNGVARGVMEHLPSMALDEERRYLAVLACVDADPERTLERLPQAGLASAPRLLAVLLVALVQMPALDYEEQKKVEILFHTGPDDPAGEKEIRRRFEQARARRQAILKHHAVRHIPPVLGKDPGTFSLLLQALLVHDPYGTLECYRELGEPCPFLVLDLEQRLALLAVVASFGLGLASNYLDLFDLAEDPAVYERLKEVFIADLTAGSSIYGVFALEGVHNYPFGLRRIEPILPRRFSNAEALAWLRKNDPEGGLGRTFSTVEVGNAVTQLQDREVRRAMELLKADVSLEWKARFPETKREIVFGDMDLKVRNILFLLAHAAFRDNTAFDQLLATLEATHPMADPAQILLLANRWYFLELIGLNPGLLFNSQQRASEFLRAPLEEVAEFRIRYLLHMGMSIYLHVGDSLFRLMPIAWNILQNQGDGRLDSAVQDVVSFFDAFDTLLVLGEDLVPDLRGWTACIVEALRGGAPEAPLDASGPRAASPLRLTTRDAITRYREFLNSYCLQTLRRAATRTGATPATILQNVRLPRNKTDKLFFLLEEDRKTRA
jgi:hypothetical protein